MNSLLFIVISTAVAALIGGVTNHYAIKMLFHPRRPVYIAGRKVPFTPGLIPKRKAEIAASLGAVVADYLVTPEGLVHTLDKPEVRDRLKGKLAELIERSAGSEETLVEAGQRFFGEESLEAGKRKLAAWIRKTAVNGIERLWEKQGLSDKKLKQLIPDWTEERKEQLVQRTVEYIVEQIKQELLTANGDRLLRRLTGQFLEQAGGLLGTLAGLFMDEDKMAQKIKAVLFERLDSPIVRGAISEFLFKNITRFEEKSVSEAVEMLTEQNGKLWVMETAKALVQAEAWLDQLGALTPGECLGGSKESLMQVIPGVVDLIMKWLQNNMNRIVAAIELPALVEEQVQKFPIERLEQILLSVSGKEFRAITWLGALLGGIIGLVQAILMRWLM